MIPFVQTSTVLINSISLVCIAMDRYLAVLNIPKSPILQRKWFSVSALILVWATGFAISIPTLSSYVIEEVIVYPHEFEEQFYVAYVCQTDMVCNCNLNANQL
jgi:hypothetical protein